MDNIVGSIIYMATSAVIPNYMVADGTCLADKDYPELARVIHEGNNWPYGRCDSEHFKLPNFCGKIGETYIGCPQIKVK